MATAADTAQLLEAINKLRGDDLASPSSARLKDDLLDMEARARGIVRGLVGADRRGDHGSVLPTQGLSTGQ